MMSTEPTRDPQPLILIRGFGGLDVEDKSEIFFGVSIKPRKVDFELFHQGRDAENCYGPFREVDLSDAEVAFDWAGKNRLIWEGWLDASKVTTGDMVLRLDFYVGERDLLGVGFSDNVIFAKQYFVRALWKEQAELYLHTGEEFARPGFQAPDSQRMDRVESGWRFVVEGTGFRALMQIEIEVAKPPE